MQPKIRLGISSCLLGEKVRYDGGHKFDPFLARGLGGYVDYVPVCPEYECGLGVPREAMRLEVPREAMRLEEPREAPRLITIRTRIDVTARMRAWCRKRVRALEKEDLQGFIFKSRSPSSGLSRVKVFDEKGIPVRKGVGLFARAFVDRFPLIPVDESDRLRDPGQRENFVARIFAFNGWRETVARRRTRANLIGFHGRHELLLRAHGEKHARLMNRLVAGAESIHPKELHRRYLELFSAALRLKTTVRKNLNVLQRIARAFKKQLSADERRELLDTLDRYRARHISLDGPITIINRFVRKYERADFADQVFLNPHPVEVALRNQVLSGPDPIE